MRTLAQQYRQSPVRAAPTLPNLFFLTLLILFCLGDRALAAEQVNIDALVQTEQGPLLVGQTAKDYTSTVVVTNTSTQEILSPVRVIITSIDRKKISVANADGFAGNDPYVEIAFGGVLGQFDSVTAEVYFVREAGKSNPGSNGNGNTKNSNFPTFNFTTSVTGGSEVAPQAPTSFPYALTPNSGIVPVVFNVGVLAEAAFFGVSLRNLAGGPDVLMNDDGDDGDQIVGDDIYSATLGIDTTNLVAGQCLSFAGVTSDGTEEIVSAPYDLCVTSFNTRVAASNEDPDNIITLNDGNIVYADEVLIIFEQGTSEADIIKLTDEIKGEVVGTILPINQYQVKLDKARSASGLEQLLSKLRKKDIVLDAGPNGVVIASAIANDTRFGNQDALQAIRADDTWDISATGAGETVIVIDEGVDNFHTDLDAVGKVVGGATVDATGHGTQMAGIIAAETDNSDAIAGVARDAAIYSVAVVDVTNDASFNQSFIDASTIAGDTVNVSLNRLSPAGHVPGLCLSINTAIEGMTGKVVVNSAGNSTGVGWVPDGAWWPARCNSLSSDTLRISSFGASPTDIIVDKSRFIVVSATNCDTDPCPGGDTHRATSNAAAWVDVAAPGTTVWATDAPGGVAGNPTVQISGTSAAAALVSGAVANLRGCGVALGDIESTLQAGSLALIAYSGGEGSGTTPRIDLYEAMNDFNTIPTGLSLTNNTIDELAEPSDTTVGPVLIGSLSIASPDACDTLSYSVGGAHAAFFQTTGSNLEFQSGVALDADDMDTYNITVTVTDYFGETDNLPVTIMLNNINEAPVLGNTSFTIAEDLAAGSPVGSLSGLFSDEDGDSASAYAITGGNPGPAFNIDSTGQITVAAPSTLDFDNPATQSYTLNVVATDDWTPAGERLQSNTATITVNITGVNDNVPVFTSANSASVPENTTAVLTLTATDADLPSAAVTFSSTVTGTDGALFQVVSNQLQFIAAPDFEAPADVGADNVYNITVSANNGSGTSGTQNITVTVTDVVESGSFFIDFETLQDGTPFTGAGDSFAASEYNGVVINDNDPGAGSTGVNLTNPANVGTDITGYHVNVGAFAATPQTQIDLDFPTPVSIVTFDFAAPGGSISVSAFDASNALLGNFNFTGTDSFINPAGLGTYGAGSASISGVGDISRIVIGPDPNTALVIDNLGFTTIP